MGATSRDPQGPPLESHISHVPVIPVKLYCKVKLKIILNIFNTCITYFWVGETDCFQYVYVFIAVWQLLFRIHLKIGWDALAPLS